jgi:hypothetical protein
LSNFVICDCMDATLSITSTYVLWEWSCQALIDLTFFVVNCKALLIATFDCSNFCNLTMPLEASYHNLPNPNKNVTWNFFICELWLWVIHLMPKTNPITLKIVDETFFRFGVYFAISKISQWLCHLNDGGGLFFTCTHVRHAMTHLDEPWGFICT